MKTKITILMMLSSLSMGCRSKHKMITNYKENTEATKKIVKDSVSLQSVNAAQHKTEDALLKEKKDEISGELRIKGKSELTNPFVYHNVVGKDTLQSITITGNAEYLISSYYEKANHEKTENKKQESVKILQDISHQAVSTQSLRKVDSAISEKSVKIKSTGFEAGAWIFITIIGIALLLIFFTYKYFKK